MNNLRKISSAVVALAASLALTSPAFAAGTISGQRINLVGIYGSSTTPYTVLTMAGAATGAPGCAPFPNVMAIDTSTTRGKAQANLVTAAFLAGRTVSLVGTGTCVTPSGFLPLGPGTPIPVEAVSNVSVQ